MRTSMWTSAQARLMGGLAAAVLMLGMAACGGGSDAPALAVNVSVDGVADGANPLTAGESATITVPSGATLAFASEGETRWDPVASDSSYVVNSFSYTAKSMTVTSNAGGTVTVTFVNKADESQKAALSISVAPKEFGRMPPIAGEIARWKSTFTFRGAGPESSDYLTRSLLLDNGGHGEDTASAEFPDDFYIRSLYDEQDAYLGWQSITNPSSACLYDVPVVYFSYPLHVGKTWAGEHTRTCNSGATFHMSDVRTAEAYERVTVPAGSFDTIRVHAELTYTNVADPNLPDNSYTVTSTCWWAVDLGRKVKCHYVYHYPDIDGYPQEALDELSSLTH